MTEQQIKEILETMEKVNKDITSKIEEIVEKL